MTLSNKSTTAYVVMATWADGEFQTWTYATAFRAERYRKIHVADYPKANVQIHPLVQALPKEEK